MHHTKKVEEYEEIEIYVRFVPHGPYRLTSQPARVIMAKVKSRCYVTSKITEQFKNNRCTADGILFVFVHKALDDAVGEVQGIINRYAETVPRRPVKLNHLHYTT